MLYKNRGKQSAFSFFSHISLDIRTGRENEKPDNMIECRIKV